MTKLEKTMLAVVIVWLVLMILFDQPNYQVTDAEMWSESLKWGLP